MAANGTRPDPAGNSRLTAAPTQAARGRERYAAGLGRVQFAAGSRANEVNR
jgi:hypothetical protein